MDRRSLLKGGAAAVLLAPIAWTPVQATEDDDLLSLWSAYIDIEARLADIEGRKKAAIAQMPAWARWDNTGEIGPRKFAPEWRPAIRKRHAVPDDFPLRPSEEDVKALNKRLVYEAAGRWIEENHPAATRYEWLGAGLSDGLLKARVSALSSPNVIAEQVRGDQRLLEHARQYCNQHRWEKRVGLAALQREYEELADKGYDIRWNIMDAKHSSLVGMLVRLKMFVYIKSEYFDLSIDQLDSADQFIIAMICEMERGLLSEAAALIRPFPELDAYMRSAVA